jgi:hypothetical protein
MRFRELTTESTGLSPETLASYKKKAGAEASALDKEAWEQGGPDAQKKIAKANKRFGGIVRATKKELDNDAKGVKEGSKIAKHNKLAKAPKPKNQQEYDAIEKYKADLAKSYQPKKEHSMTEEAVNESSTIDFIRGLISEFNTQISGSPYYPMDYKNPGMRMWTRGDGSRYKDPGYIFIERDLKPEDQPKWHKAKAVEKFWQFLASKGARKIGDVSGEFGSDPHSPAVVLNKQVFVFNGRNIAWGSTSRLKNSSVWRQKQQGVTEGAEERSQNRLWQMITDYEKRAKATKSDIKRDHYMKIAQQLRDKLKTSDGQGVDEASYSYDVDDYYDVKQSSDYGQDFRTAEIPSSRYVDPDTKIGSRSRPVLKLKGRENPVALPADPFGRTTGELPISPIGKRSRIHRVFSQRNEQVKESPETVAFEVDSENAYNHIMHRYGSRISWAGDAMVIPAKYWNEVQELALSAGGNAVEYGTTNEASLATMRDYFAGDKNAEDELKITQQRKHYANDHSKQQAPKFNSLASYHHWLKRVGAEQINKK